MNYPDYSYENFRRVSYKGGAQFVPVCPQCGRFVKADKTILENEITGVKKQSNATCKKCGRIEMPFEGYI